MSCPARLRRPPGLRGACNRRSPHFETAPAAIRMCVVHLPGLLPPVETIHSRRLIPGRFSKPKGPTKLEKIKSFPDQIYPGDVVALPTGYTPGKKLPSPLLASRASPLMSLAPERATVDSIPVPRPEPSTDRPQGMCPDEGYDFDEMRKTLEKFGLTAHIRTCGEEAKAIIEEAVLTARWVVERARGWLNRLRRIMVRWDKYPRITFPFSNPPVPSSPSEPPGCWDMLLA